VPTGTRTDTDPQRYFLSTVRHSQTAMLDTIRTWTTITEQLTRTLRFPVPDPDLDVAAAVETIDTAVAAVETTVGKRLRRAEREQRDPEQPQAPKAESPRQNRKFDGRTYEERSIDELRERAGELQLQGRSAMSKDELIAALHQHSK